MNEYRERLLRGIDNLSDIEFQYDANTLDRERVRGKRLGLEYALKWFDEEWEIHKND